MTSFLGWHRSEASASPQIKMWLNQRTDAVLSVLRTIPGGKNVFQYMQSNGWMDFGPQITPAPIKEQKKPINERNLKHYDVCVLHLYNHMKFGNRKIFAIGLVNSRLQVRPMVIETPIMSYLGCEDVLFPRVFAWKRKSEINTELDRITALIREHCRKIYQKHGLRYVDTISLAGLQSHLSAAAETVYPKFNIKGQKYSGLVESGSNVKIIVEFDKITTELDPFGFCTTWPNFVIKQLQIQPSCLFDKNFSDDE